MGTDVDWVTRFAAAEIIGCPERVVIHLVAAESWDSWPARGPLPTLLRASVVRVADEWSQVLLDNAQVTSHSVRRPGLADLPPHGPAGSWLTTQQTADILGLSASGILRLTTREALASTRHGRRRWFRTADVESFQADAGQWISEPEAAKIIGCQRPTVTYHVATGEIERREHRGSRPTLLRTSVEAFAGQWPEILRTRREAEDARAVSTRDSSPPDDGEVWFSSSETAAVLGVSKNRVSTLALTGRLPRTSVGSRVWFRRRDVEQFAAARVFRRQWAAK